MALPVHVLFNLPSLPTDHPDYASEAGVLETVEAVCQALQSDPSERWDTRKTPIEGSPEEILAALDDRSGVIFNLLEGLRGTGAGEAQVAALLELSGVPFTGAPFECLALARDKPRAKWLLRGAGIPTPPFVSLEPGEPFDPNWVFRDLGGGPLFVKPAREDASLGIDFESVVTDANSLSRRVAEIQRRFGAMLVERFIPGREFNVAILDLDSPRILPLSEIVFATSSSPAHDIVTYDAKWSPTSDDWQATPVRCPADVTDELKREIERHSLAAYRLLGCRDYARVDLRVESAIDSGVPGEPRVWILEVNANPDLSPSAGFARSLKVAGLNYDDVIRKLVERAAQRRGPPR